MHLDVTKNGSLLQKLLLDSKKCFLFGRNKDKCDFPLDHESCSRVHAALVYHKHLDRFFIIDQGSAHGTFVGSKKLESNRPQQLLVDTMISFGASTRTYTLREKPKPIHSIGDGDIDGGGGGLLGLPEDENEMDDLTQFNTAHNRQISMLGITDDEASSRRKRNRAPVTFSDSEEIINPEDIDPNIGKFRNMVQTAVIPNKKPKLGSSLPTSQETTSPHITSPTKPFLQQSPSLYADTSLLPGEISEGITSSSVTMFPFGSSSTFGLRPITSAPPIEPKAKQENQAPFPGGKPESSSPMDVKLAVTPPTPLSPLTDSLPSPNEAKRKKYAKESWPGKKPSHLLI
jgi:nuclear inhibitor of protein phosphatase 1